MKKENEPWLDHLKHRVNNYGKSLPENDWNDFEKKFLATTLPRKKRVNMLRIAAILILLLIPAATAFYMMQHGNDKYIASILPKKNMEGVPSPLPQSAEASEPKVIPPPMMKKENIPASQDAASPVVPETKGNAEAGMSADTASEADSNPKISSEAEVVSSSPMRGRGMLNHTKPHHRPQYALALAVSTGNSSTGASFMDKVFSRGDDLTSGSKELGWNEFKNYLLENPKDFPDVQARAALLQIADDNLGRPMLEHSHYNLPVSFALSLRRSLGKHWGVSAGVQYTYLSSESSVGEESEWIRRQKFHYIGLSLKLDRRLYTSNTFTLYAAGGGGVEKSVSGRLEQDFIVEKKKVYSNRENITIKPFQFSILAALGAQYNINRTIGLFAEPGVTYYFKDGSYKHTIRDEHPLNFSLQFGLRWNY